MSFDIDEKISCAPEKWYDPKTKTISWPPGNQVTLQIMKHADKKSTWNAYKCHLIMTQFYPISDYAKAKKLEDYAASDVPLSSSEPSDVSLETFTKKRRKAANKARAFIQDYEQESFSFCPSPPHKRTDR